MKKNISSFVLGLIGGVALYSGILIYQNDSTLINVNPVYEKISQQQNPVDSINELQMLCNDYEHDISSLLLISEELFDVQLKRNQLKNQYCSSDSVHREELLLGVYDILEKKHQNLLIDEYKQSFEEGLLWLKNSY